MNIPIIYCTQAPQQKKVYSIQAQAGVIHSYETQHR
jgi:hypothetical protein